MIKRDELIKQIQDYINNIYFEQEKIVDLTISLRKKYNVDPGEVQELIVNSEKLSSSPDERLFKYGSVIGLMIEKYYSEREIKEYSRPEELKRDEKSIYPIEFENVLQVNSDQLVTTISASKLYELYLKQIIVYNTLTQRAPKISIKNGKESYKIFVNENSVNSIKSLLLRDQFIPNDITLNVRPEDSDNVFYDRYNATFTIKTGTLDILDGYHRYQAIIRVLQENPDYDINFILNITSFNKDKAQRYIAQQDKKNRIRPSYAKALDNSRYETLIVKQLNEDSESLLFHAFSYTTIEGKLDIGKAIDVVGKSFKIRSSQEASLMETYIRKQLNNILDIGGDEYKKSFNDLDFRFLIIYLGIALNEGYNLNYELAVKECKKFKETIDDKHYMTINNVTKIVKESGLFKE